MSDNTWTDERVDHLKVLCGEGYSASQISMRMKPFSRNAIIGKMTRLGLKSQGPRSGRRQEKKKNQSFNSWGHRPKNNATGYRRSTTLAEWNKTEITAGIPWNDRKRQQCKWIHADNESCCGQLRAIGSPYCKEHTALAYPTASRRKATEEREVVA